MHCTPTVLLLQQWGAYVGVEGFLYLTESKIKYARNAIDIAFLTDIKGQMMIYIGLLLCLGYAIDIGDVAQIIEKLIGVEGKCGTVMITIQTLYDQSRILIV